MINYTGIPEAELIHALYLGSHALGMGVLQEVKDLTVERVQFELDTIYKRPAGGIPNLDHPNEEHDGSIRLDYYHGHPFKMTIDPKTKTFEERGFDRDQGPGRAAEIVADILKQKGLKG